MTHQRDIVAGVSWK